VVGKSLTPNTLAPLKTTPLLSIEISRIIPGSCQGWNWGGRRVVNYPGGESKFAAGSREGGQAVPVNSVCLGVDKGGTAGAINIKVS
jgi:hypothetical protein